MTVELFWYSAMHAGKPTRFFFFLRIRTHKMTLGWCFAGDYGPHTNPERNELWHELAAIMGLWNDH